MHFSGQHHQANPALDETILKAARNDPAASYEVGQFVLWRLDDPVGARPYLERGSRGWNC